MLTGVSWWGEIVSLCAADDVERDHLHRARESSIEPEVVSQLHAPADLPARK